MIGHFPVHLWLGWVITIGIAGAMYPRYGASVTVVSTLVLSPLNFIALGLSWKYRLKIEKIKPLSDTVAVIGMFLFLAILFGSSLLDGLIWFMTFILLALNLTFREDRHFYIALLTSFILLVSGAAESKSGTYLLFVIVYCAVASVCLGLYFMDKRLRHNPGIYQNMNWPVFHRVRVIALLVGISCLVYLLIPRIEAANFGSRYGITDEYYRDKGWEKEAALQQDPTADSTPHAFDETLSRLKERTDQSHLPSSDKKKHTQDSKNNELAGIGYSGFSDLFDIRGGQRQGKIPPNMIVAYMRARHGAYLKVETFDLFDGISWHKSRHSDVKMKLKYGEITLVDHSEPNYRQNITIEQNLGAYLPAAAIPVQLAFPSTVISVDSYQMIKIPTGLRKGTSYTVDSRQQFINSRLFSGDHYRPGKSDLQLPPELDTRIQKLAQQITSGAKTQLSKAGLLEKHLRENYQYSYNSIFESQNRTPVGRFLFEDKKGHCEYFASSMAVMLRSLQIPTRLVTGFSATVANPLTGYYEVRALDGHAWVEAWVDGLGWAVFEPTPFYTPPKPVDSTTSVEKIQQFVDQLDKMKIQTDEKGEISLEMLLITIWQALSVMVVTILSYLKLFLSSSWKMIIGGMVIVLAFTLLWQKWKPAVLKRLSYLKVLVYNPREPKDATRYYLKHIQFVISLNGIYRSPGTTIEQYVRELNGRVIDSQTMQKVIHLVNQVHYNSESEADVEPLYLKQVFFDLYKKT